MGTLSTNQLNELYNKSTIGIVMSNTNPSRLGWEMLASGMKVIEYDSEFTKYDMSDKHFTKIKNDDNIENIVNNLLNDSYIYPKEYIDSISIDKENENFLNNIIRLL